MRLLRAVDSEGRVVHGTIATTFTFGHRFFEQQLLDAFSDRHPSANTVVLVDADTYARTLESAESTLDAGITQPLQAVGHRYHLAPVEHPATFHPKLVFQAGEKRANAVIGSANLTQPGYTSNRELVTTVAAEADDPSSTEATVLAACRSYLSRLKSCIPTDRWSPIITAKYESILQASDWLTDYDATPAAIQLLDNLDAPLLDQVTDRIRTDGEQIDAVEILAPFYGTSLAVPARFTDAGINTTLYVQDTETQIDVDTLSEWLEHPDADAATIEADRYVHGKMLRFYTSNAVYCLTGSANASLSALLRTASPHQPVGNHELGVLRRAADRQQLNYLTDTEVVHTTGTLDVDAFSPGATTDFEPAGDRDDAEPPVIGIPTVSLYQQSHGAARITMTVRLDTTLIDPQRTSLTLTVTQSRTDRTATIPFYPADRSRRPPDASSESESPDSLTVVQYSKPVPTSVDHTFFQHACRAQVQGTTSTGADITSDLQWITTQAPDASTGTDETGARAGTDTVPQALTDLFLTDDADQRDAILGSFNSIIRAQRTGKPNIVTETEDDTSSRRATPRTDGIRVRDWDNASTSSDPRRSIETYYDQWLDDMTNLQEIRAHPEDGFDAIAARLRAINQCNIQLNALREAGARNDISEVTLPTDLPIEVTNRLYTSNQGLGSRLHWFLSRGQTAAGHATEADASVSTSTIYTWCQEDFLPNILLGALIARYQHAEDLAEYRRYFGTAFEQLILDCFPTREAITDWATPEAVALTITTIHEIIDPIIERLGQHDGLRWLPYEFRADDRLETAVLKILGHSLAESDSIPNYAAQPNKHARLLQFARNSDLS